MVGRINWRIEFGDGAGYLFAQLSQYKFYSGDIQNLTDTESFHLFPIVIFLSVIFI
jgi:hypothetical protein